ncbi:MAG: glycosyltransferase [Faecousia sp.]
MNKVFLSFIVPVYNTELFLDECLRSLLEQDISSDDYEIICVNDGSTDGSLGIVRKYEAQTPNLLVIDQDNAGVCTARNAGLEIASGDYIWFVDSDDLIQKNILAEIKEKVSCGHYDRIIIDHFLFQDAFSESGARRNTSWQDTVVWRNIFRREYLLKHDLRFHYPELEFGEDALFMYEIKRFFPSTMEVQEPYYLHRSRPGSAGSEEPSQEEKLKKLRSNLKEAQIMQRYYENENVLPETADRLMSFFWGTMCRLAELPPKDAAPFIGEMKKCGLYPYKRPCECTITKSNQLTRSDFVGKMFDYIYVHLHTRLGYHAMRAWNSAFRIKQAIQRRVS